MWKIKNAKPQSLQNVVLALLIARVIAIVEVLNFVPHLFHPEYEMAEVLFPPKTAEDLALEGQEGQEAPIFSHYSDFVDESCTF